MDIRTLNDDVAVSPQISTADLNEIAAKGYKSVICNRPDGEVPDQPDYAEIEKAAASAGLEIRYIPLVPGMLDGTTVSAFRSGLEEMPKPVLAYCRSGTRSATLWALARADSLPVDEIMQRAAKAGYDLSGMAGMIAGAARAG